MGDGSSATATRWRVASVDRRRAERRAVWNQETRPTAGREHGAAALDGGARTAGRSLRSEVAGELRSTTVTMYYNCSLDMIPSMRERAVAKVPQIFDEKRRQARSSTFRPRLECSRNRVPIVAQGAADNLRDSSGTRDACCARILSIKAKA